MHKCTPFLHRKPKLVGNSNNRISIPSTNITSKVSNGGTNVESRTLPTINGSTISGSDNGTRAFSVNKDMPSPNLHNDADFVSDARCSIPQNSGHNNCVTTPFASNIGSTTSNINNSLAPPNSNVGIMLLDETKGSNPQSFPASSFAPAVSNGLGRVSSFTNTLYLPHLDNHMDILGDTSGSITQNFAYSNVLVGPSSSEIGTGEVSSNCSLAPSNLINHSFNSQDCAGDISDSFSCIPNQENIFEDIMNELLPPSGPKSATWQFTEKL